MIVGLDLATSTGFAIGGGASLPRVAALRMPTTGTDVGAFLVFFRGWIFPTLHRLAEEAKTIGDKVVVVFEAPLLLSTDATNIATTRKLQGLAGVVEMVVTDLSNMGLPIEVYEVTLSTVKKVLTGNGRAEKGDMVIAARNAGVRLSPGKEGEDEADAFGVWLVAVRNYEPQHAARWDHIGRGKSEGSLV